MPGTRRLTVARIDSIDQRIHVIRHQRVLLDAHLAALYGVDTKVLVQAVKRNAPRFPPDFMFRLTVAEFGALRSQSVTSSDHGGRRHRPYAFTEHGVAMLSSVLRSRRAIHVNIAIMRAFVRLRESVVHQEGLTARITTLERKYDGKFAVVFEAIRELMTPLDATHVTVAPADRFRRAGRNRQGQSPVIAAGRSPQRITRRDRTRRASTQVSYGVNSRPEAVQVRTPEVVREPVAAREPPRPRCFRPSTGESCSDRSQWRSPEVSPPLTRPAPRRQQTSRRPGRCDATRCRRSSRRSGCPPRPEPDSEQRQGSQRYRRW